MCHVWGSLFILGVVLWDYYPREANNARVYSTYCSDSIPKTRYWFSSVTSCSLDLVSYGFDSVPRPLWAAELLLLHCSCWVLCAQCSHNLQHFCSPSAQNLTLGESVCIGLGCKCSLQELHFRLTWIWTLYIESRLPSFSHLYILIPCAPSKFFSKPEVLTSNS